MNAQSTTRESMHCYTCHNQTDERCSYCLLPVCSEHGEYVQPWYTRRQVLVCIPCQAKLEAIVQEEESLSWATPAGHRASIMHVLQENVMPL